MSDERLNSLEMTIAHLEQKLDELSDVVAEQDQTITALKAKLKITYSKVEEMEERARESEDKDLSPSEIAERDKPPHY